MKNVLFVCSRNRLRSPTAEAVFADWPGLETASAGLSPGAETPLTPDLLEWSEKRYVKVVQLTFGCAVAASIRCGWAAAPYRSVR